MGNTLEIARRRYSGETKMVKVQRDAGDPSKGSIDFEVPVGWSRTAASICYQKYARKAGVPSHVKKANPKSGSWLARSVPDDGCTFGEETSAIQIAHRMSGCWAYWLTKLKYMSASEAIIFCDRVFDDILAQRAAPNSPQWFNTGLHWAYGITGEPQGHYYCDHETGEVKLSENAYERPQPSACFIQSIDDDLVGDGGIMDLWRNEARLFKYGSGTGSNFSAIRGKGEPLSGGGYSSGLMSFLRIGDRTAGAIKSGGTTRRAAKMVILDADHPDIEDFIEWKVIEETKVAALVSGSTKLKGYVEKIREAITSAYRAVDGSISDITPKWVFEPSKNHQLNDILNDAVEDGIPASMLKRIVSLIAEGQPVDIPTLDTDWQGEAYSTVSGQNANNSIRLTDAFMDAVDRDADWHLTSRTDVDDVGAAIVKTVRARDLWAKINRAAWISADPGVQFDDTINKWHTCPNSAPIRGSNPCVTGDTLVATDEGWMRIDAMTAFLRQSEPGEIDICGKGYRIYGSDGLLHDIEPAFCTGEKEVFKLTLRCGKVIRLTPDHKVMTTNRGDVPACELTTNDFVKVTMDGMAAIDFAKKAAGGEMLFVPSRVVSIEPQGVEKVYDLTEPETSHFVANGIVVHNCSEYLFVDGSSCNLASANLVKFLLPDGSFDATGFAGLCERWTWVLEISVAMGQFPSREIAVNTWKFRTLGLGYANLGGLLMRKGIRYGSDEAQAWTRSITAMMTGTAYKTSALIAQRVGPFAGFEENREPMMRVMRMHESSINPDDPFVSDALDAWNLAINYGDVHGFRNAQATVLAPTGTIGLVMDCDTTGIEPDFAIVKHKSLDGGGYLRITNESVQYGLAALGHDCDTIGDVVSYVSGHALIPEEMVAQLKGMGAIPFDIDRINSAVKDAFSLRDLLSVNVVGDELYDRIGLPYDGNIVGMFSAEEEQRFSRYIFGHGTLVGAPHINDEDVAIFDCANACRGGRSLEPEAHVRMMAAAQPFISGGISKTVNLPNDATIEDIENVHILAHRLGVKCIAVYRDGSKLSQPLTSGGGDDWIKPRTKSSLEQELKASDWPSETIEPVDLVRMMKQAQSSSPTPDIEGERLFGDRRTLPQRRRGYTQKATIGGHKLYLRTGEYEDGTLGEIFVDMHKEGAAFRSLMNAFSTAVSLGLQYGVPLERYVDAFTFTRFEPAGMVVGHDRIKSATSIIDYIFRDLAVSHLGRDDLAHVNPERDAAGTEVHIEGQHIEAVIRDDDSDGVMKLYDTDEDRSAAAARMKAAIRRIKDAGNGELDARSMGYTGSQCDNCGSVRMVRSGTCEKCLDCGSTTGCS